MKQIKYFTVVGLMFFSSISMSAVVNWVDWTSASSGQVDGSVLSNGSNVSVTYNGTYIGAQTNGGTDYWATGTAYTDNSVVDNRPPASDIIRILGGANALTHTVTFSAAVVDPVMAILSLGQPGFPVQYDFGAQPFTILSSGTGHWGGASSGSLFQNNPGILTGVEGHGVIQFSGTFTSISWNALNAENWHGFQFGVAEAVVVPEPSTYLLFALGLFAVFKLKRRAT